MSFLAIFSFIPFIQIQENNLFSKSYYYAFILIIQTIVFLRITIYIESRKYSLKNSNNPPVLLDYNDQVPIDANEINAETVRIGNHHNRDPIKAINLQKIYPNGFQAVKNISCGVERAQIFGLLGPNGAGKSTTFNIMTALIPKTSGSIMLSNQEVNNNLPHIFKEVGISPQFDCLWDSLTVREHLTLFGRIKGLNGSELKENVDYYINVMMLTDQINKKARILSGGNKRKLCVSNALIGSPMLQFFDEPSTGLDAIARRFLWTTLTQNLNYRDASIVLTTHSMSEAESLCHKIGLITNK